MKKLLSVLLTLILALSALPAPLAAAQEAPVEDQPMLRSAIGMTAAMTANAVEAAFEGKQAQWGKRLAETPFTMPLKAVARG